MARSYTERTRNRKPPNNAPQRTRQTVSDFANTKSKIAAGLPRR
jgi:hypothetical protein